MLRITTRDVGLTQVATLYLGETKVVEFYTGTKHSDFSQEIAEETVARALRETIRITSPFLRIYEGDD